MKDLINKLITESGVSNLDILFFNISDGEKLASTAHIEDDNFEIIFYMKTIESALDSRKFWTKEDKDQAILRVVTHELAHVLDYRLRGKFSHDRKWSDIMNKLAQQLSGAL